MEQFQGLSAHSQAIEKSFLFGALPGLTTHGIHYVHEAVQRGATGVLVPQGKGEFVPEWVPFWESGQICRDWARLAAQFYPAQPEFTALITGTNGKSSVAYFAASLLNACGIKAASIGTLGVLSPAHSERSASFLGDLPLTGLTTPDSVTLHAILSRLARQGFQAALCEASSHGLKQHRLDAVCAKAGVFTNLSHDHLDYHGNMEDYRLSKYRLFSELLDSQGVAILNANATEYPALEAIAQKRGIQVLRCGLEHDQCALSAHKLQITRTGIKGVLRFSSLVNAEKKEPNNALPFRLPLLGRVQLLNVLQALGLVWAAGVPVKRALRFLETLSPVPGRLEEITPEGSALSGVFLDYAHTPEALAVALQTLRAHAGKRARLICVFGCGGDRDSEKRSKMGEIASRYADLPVITDDNPRTENPAKIRAEILSHCSKGIECGDRRAAIRLALSRRRASDIVLVAGKGHETSQHIGTMRKAFSDRDEILEALGE